MPARLWPLRKAGRTPERWQPRREFGGARPPDTATHAEPCCDAKLLGGDLPMLQEKESHPEMVMKEPTVEISSESAGAGHDESWAPYLAAVHARPDPWLDYSNHQV